MSSTCPRSIRLSNPQIGAYSGNITFSAVTKIASRLAARMKKSISKSTVEKLEKKLSSCEWLTPRVLVRYLPEPLVRLRPEG